VQRKDEAGQVAGQVDQASQGEDEPAQSSVEVLETKGMYREKGEFDRGTDRNPGQPP